MLEQVYTNITNIEKMVQQDQFLDWRFLALMQISSASFPVGGFSHSFGLETYVSNNKITNVYEVSELISGMLLNSLGTCDGVAVRHACRAAKLGECKKIYNIDQIISSMKLVKEIRDANMKMGKAMLRLAKSMFQNEVLNNYFEKVNCDGYGYFPVVFGAVCGCLNIEDQLAVSAFLFSSVNNLITVGTKLVPLGQLESQQALVELYPLIVETAKKCMGIDLEDISSFSPALDIASMRHEELYTRLYMS